MDGLSAAASVIAVVQVTAKVAILGCEYISSVKRAPENLQKLVDELNLLTGILATLEKNAQDPKSIALRELGTPLRRYSLEITALRDKLESKKKRFSLRRRLKWPFSEKETLGFIQETERFKMDLLLAMGIDQGRRSKDTEVNVQEIRESGQKGDIERNDDKRMKVLNWLFPEAINERHIEISSKRKKGTGEWILAAPEVQGWHQNSGLLWGYGIPGAGKTFLSSLMVDNLHGQATAGYGVAYIYFNYKEQGKQRPMDVLASLVKQLACQVRYLPLGLDDLYKDQRRPTCQDLYKILLEITKLFTQTFFIFDALDECDQRTQRKDLLPLFHQMGGDGIHLFLTSREYPEDIQYSFRNIAKIKLWAKDEDITSYIEQTISEYSRAERLVAQGNYKDKIISELIDCAQGMFLLVRFHIEYLCQQTTIRQILEELGKLKNSSNANSKSPLNPTYDRAMKTIQEQSPNCIELAIRILSWLVRARRVLTVRELQLAVSVEQNRTTFDESDLPDVKTMVDVCASLVAIGEGDTVRLVHYTVQEYLLQDPVILEHASFNVAMACTTFLSSKLFAGGACDSEGSLENRLELYPLLSYAAKNLSFHLSACEESLSKEIVLRFLQLPGSILSYLQVSHIYEGGADWPFLWDEYPKGQTQLHIACRLEHYSVIQQLLESGAKISAADSGRRTALHIVASNDRPSFETKNIIRIIHLLIERGADVSAIDRERATPLHQAAQRCKEVVRLLIEKGADISAIDKDEKTALHYAAKSQYGKGSVAHLIEKGAEISAIDKDGKTALHYAAGSQYGKDSVAHLIEKGADISATDKDGKTALHYAARSQYGKDSVAHLIEKGAEISATDKDGKTALHYAAMLYNGKNSVDYLVAKGVEISATDKDGKTALHYAAGSQYGKDSVAYLIEKEADISATDKDGKTALHYAAERGQKDSVACLVGKGADISAIDKDGKTALHYAAERGQKESAVYLIEKGADLSATNKDGKTALHYAAEHGQKDSVACLIEKGADISAIDKNRKTALHYAAERGQKESAVCLIEKGADISATDKGGKTALHYAAERGRKDSVACLIEKGADISAIDKGGKTALHYAAERGRKDSVACLIEKGADISAIDKNRKTALHYAAEHGQKESAACLIEKGADILAIDKDGKIALHYAAERGQKDSVACLIEKGADISATDKDGKTALHYAASSYNGKDSVAYLIEKGVDISATDKGGKTALHYAVSSYNGKDSIAYLIEKGADISATDKDGKTALHYAASSYNGKDSVAYLIKKRADISATDKDGKTVLHYAAEYGQKDFVARLIKKGADISAVDKNGRTALHWATEKFNNTPVVLLLLEKGANILALDRSERTVLHYAATGACERFKSPYNRTPIDSNSMVLLLLDKGADISAPDKDGKKALHFAAELADTPVVKYLLDKGAVISDRDNDGKTALHYAACGVREITEWDRLKSGYIATRYVGSESTILLLLDKGADISATDINGKTALQWAEGRGSDPGVTQLLRDKSAELSAAIIPETVVCGQAVLAMEHVSASENQ